MLLIFAAVIYTDYAAINKPAQIKTKDINTTIPIIKKEQKKVVTAKKKHSVSQKKKKFFSLVVPAIQKVHQEQEEQFEQIQNNLTDGKNLEHIKQLKKKYRVTLDSDLLLALKPHPQSIVIAQAAIESAWGTSRFFREANNIFGMWSKDPNEPRIAAGVKREGKRTIWLRKFNSLDESIRQYYQTIGRVKEYKDFRELRFQTQDVTLLVKKLDKYSELGDKYTKMLASVIRHNNLTKYDK
jgi:Bax protein